MAKPKTTEPTTTPEAPKSDAAEAPKKVAATLAAPAVIAGTNALATLGASEALVERMNEVKENLESIEEFRLPRAKMNSGGIEIMEGEVIQEFEGVVVHTKKTNVYYANPYNPNDVSPPDCFSLDGNLPDKSVEKPQNKTCKGCPMAEFGTNSMKSGKACRNLKPIFLLMENKDEEGNPVLSIMPRQLTITPASLKSANQYLMDLTERGINYRKVRTKIVAYKESPKDTYCKLKFIKGAALDLQLQKDVEFIRSQWLPIMNNQSIDQSEADNINQGAEAVPTTSGEY